MNFKKGTLIQKIALGLIFALIFSYTVYHVISLFGENLETYAAGVTTETRSISHSGFIFRDETVLTSDYTGVVEYHVANGTKVAKNQRVATVYSEGSSMNREQIRQYDQWIALLEESISNVSGETDMKDVKQAVNQDYNTLIKMLANREAGGLRHYASQLLTDMNRANLLTQGENATIHQSLEELKSNRAEILAQGGDSLEQYAARSGYFYNDVDGMEPYFTMEAAETLTADDFYSLTKKISDPTARVREAYGKIGYDIDWMLVLPVPSEEGTHFQVGQTYSGIFEENNQQSVPLTLERIEDASEYGTTLLIFRADRQPESFSFTRCQTVRLEIETVRGIYVPKSVVARKEGEYGVYVLRGSVVQFRYIQILYEGGDYYLVRANVETEDERIFLEENDRIILNGKNLFDGRVMD